MEWLGEKRGLATRDINSNSAGETEELIEKQEKVIDQLDKKRKVDIQITTQNCHSLPIDYIRCFKRTLQRVLS